MPPAFMTTPCTAVRFQNSLHHWMSYRAGARSVILVWPHRMVRRYHGNAAVSHCSVTPWGTVAIRVAPIALCTNSRLFIIQNASRISNCKFRLLANFDVTIMNVELKGWNSLFPNSDDLRH